MLPISSGLLIMAKGLLPLVLLLYATVLSAADCDLTFPDVVASHGNGELKIEHNVRINNGDDRELQFGSIDRSGKNHCDRGRCTIDQGNPAATLNPGSFKSTNSSVDLDISNNGQGTIGNNGTNRYDEVKVGERGTLNVASGISEFRINKLELKKNATWNIRAGVAYWIRDLLIEESVTFTITGSGTAQVFVKNSLTIETKAKINNNSASSKFFLFGYNDIEIKKNVQLSGFIYSRNDILIDERVSFTGAMTADEIEVKKNATLTYDPGGLDGLDTGGLCGPSGCILDRFDIIQPPYALACPGTRAKVDITARCDDGSVHEDYDGSVSLSAIPDNDGESNSIIYDNPTGGSEIYSYNFSGDENGQLSVYLYHNNENDVRIRVEDSAAGIVSTADDATQFRTEGFAASQPGNFVCGASGTMVVTALGQNPADTGCNVLEGFTGTKEMKAWFTVNVDPAESPGLADSTGVALTMNGTAVTADSVPSSANLSLDFNQGEASVVVGYQDVGEILSVNLRHDDPPYDGSVPELSALLGSAGSFVVYPSDIAINVADTNAACLGASANCSAFVAAGEELEMIVEAQCAGGSKANSYQGSVDLEHSLAAPAAKGVKGNLGVVSADILATDAGAVTISDQTISEVGVFKFKARPEDYFGQAVSTSETENIGRFYPDHFRVSLFGADFAQSCGDFTYHGQDFFFASAPELAIVAKNKNGVTTTNYEGDFWRLGSALEESISCDQTIGQTYGYCYEDQVAGDSTLNVPFNQQNYSADLSDANGVQVITLHSGNAFSYGKEISEQAPFDADVWLRVVIDDGDATGSAELVHIGFENDTLTVNDLGEESFNNIPDNLLRYGRLKLENAFGPETQSLKLPMEAEYWDGISWIINTSDECTSFAANMLVVEGVPGNLTNVAVGGGTTDITYNQPLIEGDAGVKFSAPGAGNTGTVNFKVDLDSYPWLRFDYDGNGVLEGTELTPEAEATFGQYRGHDRLIYWREVF